MNFEFQSLRLRVKLWFSTIDFARRWKCIDIGLAWVPPNAQNGQLLPRLRFYRRFHSLYKDC